MTAQEVIKAPSDAQEFELQFDDPWEPDESFQIKILEDLGEGLEMIPNDEGIEELAPAHKYRVEILQNRITMVKEAYVSFETAKLLKEKGFDEDCFMAYEGGTLESSMRLYGEEFISNSECDEDVITAPTHQIVMRWLREVYNIIISVYPFSRECVSTEVDCYTCDIATSKLTSQYGHLRGVWNTYEECMEDAIKYCLKRLI